MHSFVLRLSLPVAALLLGTPASPARCESARCECVAAAQSGMSAADFVRLRRDRAERVVQGAVVRVDTLPIVSIFDGQDTIAFRPVVAHVRVDRVWKGSLDDTMTVRFAHAVRRSSCDLSLDVGKSYLIFAQKPENGALETAACSGTVEERQAEESIAALGVGRLLRARDP